jgi:hypothetical protein
MSGKNIAMRISMKDMKIGKIGNNFRQALCAQEFSSFLTAVNQYGSEDRVPGNIKNMLEFCLENHVSFVIVSKNEIPLCHR